MTIHFFVHCSEDQCRFTKVLYFITISPDDDILGAATFEFLCRWSANSTSSILAGEKGVAVGSGVPWNGWLIRGLLQESSRATLEKSNFE